MESRRLASGILYSPPTRTGEYSAPSHPAQLPALKPLNSFPSGQGSRRMKLGSLESSWPSCWARTEPMVGRVNGGLGAWPRWSRLIPSVCSFALVCMERTTASLSAMEAHFGRSSEKWVPGTFVGMLLKGPPVVVPGLGSQVSNWLGPPQSQRRIQCFCFFLAISAKAGAPKRPAKLIDEIAPAERPCRNLRRWRL